MAGNIKFYVGNLSSDITKEDVTKHFRLDITPYLRSSCWVELPLQKPGKTERFAFISVPENLAGKVLDLNGSKLYDRRIRVEPARNQPPSSYSSYYSYFPPSQLPATMIYPRRNFSYPLQGPSPYSSRTPISYEQVTVPPEKMLVLTDVGVNLSHKIFSLDLDYVITRAERAGVHKMILTGNTMGMSRASVNMSKTRPGVLHAAVGIHPHFVDKQWNDKTYTALQSLAEMKEVVAIGEVGLDFHRNYSSQEKQMAAFEKQVELACKVQKPLLVHERNSSKNVLEVLSRFTVQLPSVVIHCFTGTAAEMSTFVAMGFYIGITGFICKESGKELREALKDGVLPLDRLLLETDAPYMVPNAPSAELDNISKKLLSKCKMGRNEPCTLHVIANTVAKCYGIDAEEVAKVTTENARRVFELKPVV